MRKVFSLFTALALSVMIASPCYAVSVTASIFPVYDWVREISKGVSNDITLLLDSGADLHSYQPSAEDIVRISDSDLFVYVGGESDEWADDVSENDVNLCVVLSAVTVILFVYFYNRIFAVTFDEEFASACGTNAKLCNLITAVITAVVIVLSMKLAGALLISALVVFPALSAMRVFRSFLAVTVCSAVISVSCALAGMLVSILAGTPVGSTIAAADMVMFAAFFVTGKILGRR